MERQSFETDFDGDCVKASAPPGFVSRNQREISSFPCFPADDGSCRGGTGFTPTFCACAYLMGQHELQTSLMPPGVSQRHRSAARVQV